MTVRTMLRVATLDTAHAADVACSDVESAVGLRARAEFQEIEGGNVIVELQLGDEAEPAPHPSRLASVIDGAVSTIEVLRRPTERVSQADSRSCAALPVLDFPPMRSWR